MTGNGSQCKIAHMYPTPAQSSAGLPTGLPSARPTGPPQSVVPDPAPPYPLGPAERADDDRRVIADLEHMQGATRQQTACWSMYLVLRRWWFQGIPNITTGPNPEEHRRTLSRLTAAFNQNLMNAKTPFGVMVDTKAMADVLGFLSDPQHPDRNAVAQAAWQTAKMRGYPDPDSLKEPSHWPSLQALDEMEMVCVHWLASSTAKHENVFKQTAHMRLITLGLARREAVGLINTWRAVMALAMKRPKDEVAAEAELQLLEAADAPEATPALKLASTKALANLHGLGKEDGGQSVERTLLELLAKPMTKEIEAQEE